MPTPLHDETAFVVPADAVSWPDRIEAACAVLEEHLAPARLLTATPPQKEPAPIPLADRSAFLRRMAGTKRRYLALSNDGQAGCSPDAAYVSLLGVMGRGTPDSYGVSYVASPTPWDRTAPLMAAIGDALGALTGRFVPIGTALRLRNVQQGVNYGGGPDPLRGRLPALRTCTYGGLQAPEQPEILGWLNYWSPRACEYLGFPDSSRDAALLRQSWRTPAGAWMVQVTPEPLDLARPGHLEALARVYECFPRIGVRL